jgi:G3E family GTPase
MNLAILLVLYIFLEVVYCALLTRVTVVDSQLAKETNVGVQEMVNGCFCCVLVGQMKLALEELRGKKAWRLFFLKYILTSSLDKYNPDRIIVETSGSAFPGKSKSIL